jgi:hypothetical protein
MSAAILEMVVPVLDYVQRKRVDIRKPGKEEEEEDQQVGRW